MVLLLVKGKEGELKKWGYRKLEVPCAGAAGVGGGGKKDSHVSFFRSA